jgi:hypothetical protein
MRHRLLDRLSYANVVATLALFIALGGTSYAAIKLPKNSVGSTQIKTGAVHTGEIFNGTIRLGDMSKSAQAALRGQTGPQGPAGPAGPPAMRHFATVSSAGGFIHGDANHGGRTGIGTYTVGFAESVGSCAFDATIGTADPTVAPLGRAQVSVVESNVNGAKIYDAGVQTYDASGAPADLPFHLIVAC